MRDGRTEFERGREMEMGDTRNPPSCYRIRSRSPIPNRPRASPVLRRSVSRERDYLLRRAPEGFSYEHKYMSSTDVGNVGGNSMLMRASSSMLVRKPVYLDDGMERSFFSVSEETGRYPAEKVQLSSYGNTRSIGGGGGSSVDGGVTRYRERSSENMRSIGGGSPDDGVTRYHERSRDFYGGNHQERVYSRDVAFAASQVSSSFVGQSSSSFAGLYGGGGSKYSDDPLERRGYNRVQLSDPVRKAPPSPPARVQPMDYRFDDLGHRGRDDRVYLPLDDPYQRMVYGHRDERRDTIVDPPLDDPYQRMVYGHRDERRGTIVDAPLDDPNQRMVYDHRDERRDTTVDPSVTGRTSGRAGRVDASRDKFNDGSSSGYAEFGLKPSRGRELPSFEESYGFMRDSAQEAYRERVSSPPALDHRVCRRGGSPQSEKFRMDAKLDYYDPSPERMGRRKYVTSDDFDGGNVYRRIRSSSRGDELWSDDGHGFAEDGRQFLPPKEPGSGHSPYRMPSHKLPGNSKREGSHLISLQKRLRPGSITWERKQDLSRAHNVWRRGQDDKNGSLNVPVGAVLTDSVRREKKDPPLDSEEFKHQVHSAFLRFSKLLNESPRIQKMYKHDQGKSSNLLCCACGSRSKEFVDTHSLLSHSYHTLKVGLRTEHLGFHKALCVLNGWNWLVVPDTGKEYMRRPPSEIKALKEDLILWPPVVIIHNSSIGNKNRTIEPKLVSIEGMGELLKEMGIGGGKAQVCRGKPANQNLFLVKFHPTFSGLQEAEKLHKYYTDKNRGREAIQRIASNGVGGEAREVKVEEFLYGYMAVAEDLDKLDPETKKRCLVKRKKDIDAIADASLSTEWVVEASTIQASS